MNLTLEAIPVPLRNNGHDELLRTTREARDHAGCETAPDEIVFYGGNQ